MDVKTSLVFLGAAALCIGAVVHALPVRAETSDPVVEQARSAGLVGEQADGYLGVAGSVSPEVKAHVDQINIKRRAVYTDLAGARGVTVADVAAATACQLLQSNVAPGQKYRDETNSWHTRAPGTSVPLPGYCG